MNFLGGHLLGAGATGAQGISHQELIQVFRKVHDVTP
jgi:hypothetical protein